MEKILQQINRDFVMIKRKDRVNNNRTLYLVLEEVIKIMRSCDRLFDNMKPRLEYMGSYFDGLRVHQPTEYDINIVLELPVDYEKIKLDSSMTSYDYTNIIMPSEFRRLSKIKATKDKGFIETKAWCNRDHLLSVNKFRSWMQGVIDTALNKFQEENGIRILRIENNVYQVFSKMSGPANTVTIGSKYLRNEIDIDLVPTFQFQLPKVTHGTTINFNKVISCKSVSKNSNLDKYFAVPKPNDNNFSWRLSFPIQEKFYISNKNNMKSAIRLLKLLRDVQMFHGLASYYIKTIFLWEVKKQNDSFWKNKSLSFIVLYMMKQLRDSLREGKIINFWCDDNNLIEKIRKETLVNWSNRLSRILVDIEKNQKVNPSIILNYFCHAKSTGK